MPSIANYRGIIPAIACPFTPDHRIDEPVLRKLASWLAGHDVELVVCAGYMHLLTPAFLARFPALNVHPSLLPAFPGTTPVEDALAAGVRETGVTVHVVDEGVDTGPVLLQEPVPVEPGDTPESLRERLHGVEHRLLPAAVRRYLAGGLRS